MKTRLLTLLSIIVFVIDLYGQNTQSHFKYEKDKYGTINIIPLNEVNPTQGKEEVSLHPRKVGRPIVWEEIYQIKPFQELVDSGVFSKDRIRELIKEDQTNVSVYFDETGSVKYIFYCVMSNKKSLLTDKELVIISQKLKTVKYDLSPFIAMNVDRGIRTVFFHIDFYTIPFKDLKY